VVSWLAGVVITVVSMAFMAATTSIVGRVLLPPEYDI
jgi:hypothetical protein